MKRASISRGFNGAWLGLLLLLIAGGLAAGFRIFNQGHYLFNANDVLLWTLPLGVYIFLALTSSGLTLLASIPLVFDVRKYNPVAKRLVFLAAATLAGAFVALALELGDVFNLIYILLSPNLGSPIWWMGFIYGVELIMLAGKLWRLQIGDWDSTLSKFLGIAGFISAIIAPLMLGSVFGLTESRVTYFGPMMSIYCLLMAMLSGSALFLLYHLIHSAVTGAGMPGIKETISNDFARIFAYILGIVIIFTLVKIAIESATTIPEFLNYRKYAQIFGGIGAFNTEVLLGLFLPFLLMSIPAVRAIRTARIVASALALVGTLAMHMEILLAGQSRPIGPKAEQFPAFISYVPSGYEWMVLVLAIAVMLLLYTLGERYLQLEAAPGQ